MNCQSTRRFLYAFADGELSVKDNCELLDHLKMCPECSRHVAEQQGLRQAVGRVLSTPEYPAGLSDRVFESLRRGRPAARRQPRFALWLSGLAAAASIALAATVTWRTLQKPASDAPDVVRVTRDNTAASLVVRSHESCCEAFDTHHNEALPHSLDGLAVAINAHFSEAIHSIAPDLSADGFQFESANFCEIRPGQPGGHLIYAAGDGGRRLSIFNLPRWSCIDSCGGAARFARQRECTQYSVEQQSREYSVVAWHDDSTTFICCGEMSCGRLREMVGPLKIAMQGFNERYAALLASTSY